MIKIESLSDVNQFSQCFQQHQTPNGNVLGKQKRSIDMIRLEQKKNEFMHKLHTYTTMSRTKRQSGISGPTNFSGPTETMPISNQIQRVGEILQDAQSILSSRKSDLSQSQFSRCSKSPVKLKKGKLSKKRIISILPKKTKKLLFSTKQTKGERSRKDHSSLKKKPSHNTRLESSAVGNLTPNRRQQSIIKSLRKMSSRLSSNKMISDEVKKMKEKNDSKPKKVIFSDLDSNNLF